MKTTQMARAVHVYTLYKWIVVQLLRGKWCGRLHFLWKQFLSQRKGKLYHWSAPQPYGFVCRKCTSFSAQLEWMHASCGARQHVRLDRSIRLSTEHCSFVHLALNLKCRETRIYTFATSHCAHICRIRCSMHANVSKTKPQTRNEKNKTQIYFHLRCGFHLNLRSKYHESWQREGVREFVRYCIGFYLCSGRTAVDSYASQPMSREIN